jgi:hypothetical protein
MTRLKVKIDKEKDLPELQALFDRMGIKYWLTEDDDLLDPANKENAAPKTATEEEDV